MENQDKYHGKGALDAFLNLFSLITLGWMSISIGMILFQIIDKFFSSEKVYIYNSFSQSGLKFGLASSLIVVPIFLVIIALLHKHYKNNVLNHQSGVYRWLTYLVLLVAALNIIGRLIQLIYQFLDGNYTLASVLKILVVLLIASGIFGYYWYDLKRTDYSSQSLVSKIFFIGIVVISLVTIIGGFMLIDSPQTTRMKKQDQSRVDALNNIRNIIISEYMSTKVLPSDLSAPKFSNLVDPVTGQPYEYRVIGETAYELCANFELAVDDYNDKNRYMNVGGENWDFHQGGRQCYEQEVSGYDSKMLNY
ncbi:hypothetical protein GW933_00570 [Candidatus Falkowbacteria bacterium]|uniref:DUF5671 domain-containing protein n=1 Tax=Candidatus Buchananbacteria bacterium CG10_big_fil_rev_8_21_14_0_10_33_19 TaxID=1974525 RepID=A0A2H0W316_9BACT|nr:hypothetical protein [Candidatus Falkowbacteria bacterium]PIS05753.1 MAG: hypothetical protein COT80_03195 [Candidatus Buchananbacteria bacterium CG10_big_fil_rev_8_21_14_0_10_33_19]